LRYLIFFFIFFSTIISGADSNWEGLIVKKILLSISHNKDLNVYSQDKHVVDLLKNIKKVHLTTNCDEADLVLSNLHYNERCHKPEIVFNYSEYINSPDAIGVFFWQKGRPTIRFSEQRLKEFGLHIDGELAKFVTAKNY